MDSEKKDSLIKWISAVGESFSIENLKELSDGEHFMSLLSFINKSDENEQLTTREAKFGVLQKHLEDFYKSSCVMKHIDFNLLLHTENELELAKVALLLMYEGVQCPNNEQFVKAATKFDMRTQMVIKLLIESLMSYDASSQVPPVNMDEMLMEKCDQSFNYSPTKDSVLLVDGGCPTADDSYIRRSSCSSSLMSPFRKITVADNSTQVAPIKVLMSSPVFTAKVIQREREQRNKAELDAESALEVTKKLERQLNLEKHLRSDLEFDLQEALESLKDKEKMIRELTDQVMRLKKLQDEVDELTVLKEEAEQYKSDALKAKKCLDELSQVKNHCQYLEKENFEFSNELLHYKSSEKELERLQEDFINCRSQFNLAEVKIRALNTTVQHKENENESLMKRNSVVEENLKKLQMMYDNLKKIHEEETINEEAEGHGESMGVVTDKIVVELQAKLDQICSDWMEPGEYRKLQLSLQDVTEQKKAFEEKFMEVQEQLLSSRSNKDQLESNLQKLEQESEELRDRRNVELVRMELLTTQVKSLEEKEGEHLKEEAKLKKKVEELNGSLMGVQQELTKVQAELQFTLVQADAESRTNNSHRQTLCETLNGVTNEKRILEQNLKQQKQLHDERVHCLKGQITSLKEELLEKASLQDDLSTVKAAFADSCNALENERAANENMVRLLKEKLQETAEELKEITKQLQNEIWEERQAKDTLTCQLSQVKEDLEQQLDDLSNQKIDLQAKVQSLQHQLGNKQQEKEAMQVELEQVNCTLAEQQLEADRKINSYCEKVTYSESQLNKASQEVKRLLQVMETEKNSHKCKLLAKDKQVKQLQSANEDLQESSVTLSGCLKNLQTEKDQLARELEDVRKTTDAAKAVSDKKIEKLETKIQKLNLEMETMQQKHLEEWNRIDEELVSSRENANKNLIDLKEESSLMKEEFKSTRETLTNEVVNLNEELNIREERIAVMTKSMDGLQAELQRVREDADLKLKEKLEVVSKMESEIVDLKLTLDGAKAQAKAEVDWLREHEERQLREVRQSCENEIGELKNAECQLRREHEGLLHDYEETRKLLGTKDKQISELGHTHSEEEEAWSKSEQKLNTHIQELEVNLNEQKSTLIKEFNITTLKMESEFKMEMDDLKQKFEKQLACERLEKVRIADESRECELIYHQDVAKLKEENEKVKKEAASKQQVEDLLQEKEEEINVIKLSLAQKEAAAQEMVAELNVEKENKSVILQQVKEIKEELEQKKQQLLQHQREHEEGVMLKSEIVRLQGRCEELDVISRQHKEHEQALTLRCEEERENFEQKLSKVLTECSEKERLEVARADELQVKLSEVEAEFARQKVEYGLIIATVEKVKEERVMSLESECHQKSESIHLFEQQVEHLERQLSKEKEQYKLKVAQLEADDNLKITELQKEVEQLKLNCKQKELNINMIEAECAHLKSEHESKVEKLKCDSRLEMEELKRCHTKEVLMLHSKHENLESCLNQLRIEASKVLEKKSSEYKNEMTIREQEYMADLNSLREQLQRAANDLSDVKAKHNHENMNLKRYETITADLNLKIKSLEDAVQLQKTSRDDDKATYESLLQEKESSFKVLLQNQEERIDNLTQELNDMHQELEKEQAASSQAKKLISQQQQRIASIEEEKAESDKQRHQMEQHCLQMERRLNDDFQTQFEKVQKESSNKLRESTENYQCLTKQLEQCQKKLASVGGDRQMAMNKLQEMELSYGKLQETVSSWKRKRESEINDNRKLEEQVEHLEMQKQKLHKKAEYYLASYNKMSEDVQSLKAKLDHEKQNFDKCKRRLQTMSEERKKLSLENTKLSKKVSSLEVELQEGQNQMKPAELIFDERTRPFDDKISLASNWNDSLENIFQPSKPYYLRSQTRNSFSNSSFIDNQFDQGKLIKEYNVSPISVTSTHSRDSIRSTSSRISSASRTPVPRGAGKFFACDEEPDDPLNWDRLGELKRRNTLCLPHLKSSYPVETQVCDAEKITNESLKLAVNIQSKNRKRKSAEQSSHNLKKIKGSLISQKSPGHFVSGHLRKAFSHVSESMRQVHSLKNLRNENKHCKLSASSKDCDQENVGTSEVQSKGCVAYNIGFTPKKPSKLKQQTGFIEKSLHQTNRRPLRNKNDSPASL